MIGRPWGVERAEVLRHKIGQAVRGAQHEPHAVTQPLVPWSTPSASGETCPEQTGPVAL